MGKLAGQRVVILGGTGLVGSALAGALLEKGATVQVVSRSPHPSQAISFRAWEDLPSLLPEAQAIVNLAGEGIADRRWTSARKAQLAASRIGLTQRLVEMLAGTSARPAVLVNASAVGYYGNSGEGLVDERQGPGDDFLARLCRDWEAAAMQAESLGVRVVIPRLGVVLAREGGALPRLAAPIRWFAGTPLGTGRQGFSWIHREDLVRLLINALEDPAFVGPLNATAPHPSSQRDFSALVARRLHRPLWPAPAWATASALKLILGEMAESMLLGGAFVIPRKALELGFRFCFPTLGDTLQDLL